MSIATPSPNADLILGATTEAAKKRISRKIGWGRHAPVDIHQDRRTIVLPHGKGERSRLDALRRAWTPTAEESGRTRD